MPDILATQSTPASASHSDSVLSPPSPLPGPPSPPLPALTPIHTALLPCRFSSWYPAFRKISPKATVLDVSTIQPDFYEWLEEDGLILPRGSGAGVVGGEEDDFESDTFASDVQDPDESDSDSDSNSNAAEPRDFSLLDERIRGIIEKYDGEVFPKLDWSAPRDAAWILPGQALKCTTPADVYLLLKSSDFVAKDLTQLEELNGSGQDDVAESAPEPITGQEDPLASLSLDTAPAAATASTPVISASSTTSPYRLNLIIKRHFNLNPSHEFRCFVRANQFVGITQRDSTFYAFLQDTRIQREIRFKLLNFWQDNIKGKLPMSDYVFDVYFTRDRSKVFIMDINPYIPRTDAILWDWDELEVRAQRSWRRDHLLRRHQQGSRSTTNGATTRSTLPSHSAEDADSDSESSDSDTGSSASDSDSDPDPRGEPFVRIYTDGRPPTTHYAPREPRRIHRILPSIRLLASEEESSAAGGRAPAYASNMVPRDMIDVSSGRGVEEFAKVWREETERSSR